MSDPNDTSANVTKLTGTQSSGSNHFTRNLTTIRVPKDPAHRAKKIGKAIRANQDTIERLSETNRKLGQTLWAIIRKSCPQTKKHQCSFNNKRTVTLLRKL